MRGIQRWAAILRVLIRGLCCIMSIMFSYSTSFRCIWRSIQRSADGGEHEWTYVCQGFVLEDMCTLIQALRLCTGRTAHRGSRGIALPFLDHGTRRGWGVSVTPRPLFTPGKDPVPIVQEAGWAPGPVWTGAENLAPTGIRSPDRPTRSQSLYRLSYPAHLRGYKVR